MKRRIEFVYDKRKDQTVIIVWEGMRIVDQKIMPNELTKDQKKRIKEEILNNQ